MKLVILGANGRTGELVLQAALKKGMDVTAVVRSAGKKPTIIQRNINQTVFRAHSYSIARLDPTTSNAPSVRKLN